MCRPASFIALKDRILWSKVSDSHEDIIREYNIHMDGVRGPNGVRFEITPRDGNYAAPAREWIFRIDQDKLPDWFDPQDVEARGRNALGDWFAWKVLLSGYHSRDAGCFWLYNSASAELRDSASAELRDSASAELWDSARAELWGSTRAVLRDSASAVLWERSIARKFGGSPKAKLHGKLAVVVDQRGRIAKCRIGKD